MLDVRFVLVFVIRRWYIPAWIFQPHRNELVEKGSKITVFLAIIITIVSVGWSIYFHSLFQNEGKLKEKAENELKEVRAQLELIKGKSARLAKDLMEARKLERSLMEEKKSAAADLERAEQRIARLEGDLLKASDEIRTPTLEPERLAKINPGGGNIDDELEIIREEKRRLELVLQERTGAVTDSVDLGEVKVHTGKRFSGSILVVNRRYDFVVIDLGREHGMETDVVLILHRGSKFLGKVMVEKVYARMSAATLMLDWIQGEPQVGDGVKKF
jgi:hypothetical protein